MSLTGIPSVMQTTNASPAAADSKTASAAKGEGTKIRLAFAFYRLLDGVEHRDTVQALPTLARSDPGNNICAIGHTLSSMKASLFACDALHYQTGVFVD
jgi:hypothetical protein